jgi:oxygen-independent coproporphyrinogen-3 oxidase
MRAPHDTPILPLVQTRTARGEPSYLTAAAALDRPHPPVRSLYIHTPFCVHKCHYCDFYSLVDIQDRQEPFLHRLIDELRFLAPHAPGPLETIFVGGGTPSLLRPRLWERLLAALHDLFDLSLFQPGAPGAPPLPPTQPPSRGEFTVECNPESASPPILSILAAGGVNRISLGAQSFLPRHLKTLERWHDPANVARAIDAARAAGIPRLSIDLIFAIPGQSVDDWRADLEQALALGTTHLSCYNLTYEPGTAMTARLRAGEFRPVEEDIEVEMFTLAGALLASRGLERYEVSNFARAGHQCRHNLAYWRQHQWLAAGPSASGHVGGCRWKNVPRLGDYLASAGPSPVTDFEPPDPRRALRERLMTGLRLAEGVDTGRFIDDLDAIAPGSTAPFVAAVRRAADRGLLVDAEAEERWRLTDAGLLLADGIAAELMSLIA